jgi:hypothetical protein
MMTAMMTTIAACREKCGPTDHVLLSGTLGNVFRRRSGTTERRPQERRKTLDDGIIGAFIDFVKRDVRFIEIVKKKKATASTIPKDCELWLDSWSTLAQSVYYYVVPCSCCPVQEELAQRDLENRDAHPATHGVYQQRPSCLCPQSLQYLQHVMRLAVDSFVGAWALVVVRWRQTAAPDVVPPVAATRRGS